MPTVSIIIPVYNAYIYLKDCTTSILRQPFKDFEIILIDDGSSDGSSELCEELCHLDRRVKCIHTPNNGAAKARNIGLSLASGEYIWFVDADDLVEENALQTLVDEVTDRCVDCVLFDSTRFYRDDREVVSPLFSCSFYTQDHDLIDEIQRYFLYPPSSRFYTSSISTGYIAPWSKFLKADVIAKNSICFDEELEGLFEDGMFTLRMFDVVSSVSYLPIPLYRYRFRSNSLIHAFDARRLAKRNRSFAAIEKWLNETDKGTDYWAAYHCHVISHFGGLLSRYFYHPENEKTSRDANEELEAVLASEPYRSAARRADFKLLKAKDKLLKIFMSYKMIFAFRIYNYAKLIFGK